MIDHDKIIPIIEDYKKHFREHWKGEKYKWEAVKHFQDNWDIEASDFAKMLDNSLAKTDNLLASANNFPRGMIVWFAQAAPEEVRGMFADLFDESREVFQRIDEFKTRSAALLEKYRSGAAQHYQNENSISIYLWLRYPDKYYIYKITEVKSVANALGSDYRFKNGAYADNMRNFYKLYDEICEELKKDTELVEILKSNLTDSCWQDNELKTLTMDFGFYISKYYSQRSSSDNWFGTDFNPGLSAEDWGKLLQDKSVFTESALEIMKRMKDYGGAATCTQLSIKYGETKNFYNAGSVAIARRVCEATGITPYVRKDGTTQWWSMLYTGRSSNKDEEGSFVWKLRDELSQALDNFDFSGVELYANKRYWLCAPGEHACIWDECIEREIIAIGWDSLGDYREYSSKQEITQALGNSQSMSALAVWQFLNEMKAGDVVFAKKGLYSVLGRGVVKSEYIYDPSRSRYKNVRRVEWTDIKEVPYPGQATQKTLTDITDMKNVVYQLNSLYDNNVPMDNSTDSKNKNYWWLNANPRIWSFSDIAVGEVVSYTLYNENGNKRRVFQNFLDAKAGDMFIGYESNPAKQVVAMGRISAEQDGEKIYFEKVRDLKNPIDYAALHDCPELEKMEYFQNSQGSLFKLTKDEYDFILDMISTEDSAPFGASYKPYTKADFLKEVFMTEGEYDRLRALVLRNKNVILQGAPGVGKTFSAKRLAYSIIGEKNKNRVCMVQFHQNYSYEDFIMGYRPNDSGGFELQTGVFYDFCERCKESSEPYFFIIDEINRGNLSKIFGELLMLIENDKRGEEHKINLVYGGKSFYIPENLYIIGLMNTADRSLAMIDYALRRRFSFYTMRPAFDDAQRNGFGEYTKNVECELYHKVIAKIKDLNSAIRADSALGRGFEIGHSYFAPEDTTVIDDEWVRGVVEFEIIPLIEEYWFDDDKRVKEWTDTLRFALGDSYDR